MGKIPGEVFLAIQTISIPYVAFVYSAPEKTDEDCLTLNVWSPDTHASLPVIVWIHGGGWRTGSSSMPVFDGSHYAEIGNVVFVTINYRLGVLGWAAHPDLRDADTGAFANWAVQDQVAALHWVSDNIAAFGGDPDRITVMGQSGGAINSIMRIGSVTAPLGSSSLAATRAASRSRSAIATFAPSLTN